MSNNTIIWGHTVYDNVTTRQHGSELSSQQYLNIDNGYQWHGDTGPGSHQAATDWEIDRNNSRDCNDREPGADMISPSQASQHCPALCCVVSLLHWVFLLSCGETFWSHVHVIQWKHSLNWCCRWDWKLFYENSHLMWVITIFTSGPGETFITNLFLITVLTSQLVTRVTWRHNSHITRDQGHVLSSDPKKIICIHLSFLFPVSEILFKYDLEVICKITPRQCIIWKSFKKTLIIYQNHCWRK